MADLAFVLPPLPPAIATPPMPLAAPMPPGPPEMPEPPRFEDVLSGARKEEMPPRSATGEQRRRPKEESQKPYEPEACAEDLTEYVSDQERMSLQKARPKDLKVSDGQEESDTDAGMAAVETWLRMVFAAPAPLQAFAHPMDGAPHPAAAAGTDEQMLAALKGQIGDVKNAMQADMSGLGQALALMRQAMHLMREYATGMIDAAALQKAAEGLQMNLNDGSVLGASALKMLEQMQILMERMADMPKPALPHAAAMAMAWNDKGLFVLPGSVRLGETDAPRTNGQMPPGALQGGGREALPLQTHAGAVPLPDTETSVQPDASGAGEEGDALPAMITSGVGGEPEQDQAGAEGEGTSQNMNSLLLQGSQGAAPKQGVDAMPFARLLEQAPQTQPSPAEQMVAHVRALSRHGDSRIQIQLHPVELGKLDIYLEVTREGKASLSVTADNPRTLEWLRSDVRVLERLLTDIGLKADAGSLSFSLHDERQPGQQAQPQPRGDYRNAPVESVSDQAVPAQAHTYVLTAAEGLDIRI